MGLINEFKEFAVRGNVVDMAVGIVIGGAFGKIATSLVTDVIMPPIGVVTKGMDFSSLSLKIQDEVKNAEGLVTTPAVYIQSGVFFNTVINFIVVALAMFVVVKLMNRLKKKEEVQPTVTPPKHELLLEEIRDILKHNA